MPLPRPTQAEEEESFLTRCMGDKVMIEEFPKLEQRFAVCKIQWDAVEDKDEEDAEDALKKLVSFLERYKGG